MKNSKLALKLAKKTLKVADLKSKLRSDLSSLDQIRDYGNDIENIEKEMIGISNTIISQKNAKKSMIIERSQQTGPTEGKVVCVSAPMPFSVLIKEFQKNSVTDITICSKTFVSNKIHWFFDERPNVSSDQCRYKITVSLEGNKAITSISVPQEITPFITWLKLIFDNRMAIHMDMENCPCNQ